MKLFFQTLLLVSALLGQLSAATINVPADQPTIQAGIDAANIGDTVLIATGTYTGPGNRNIVGTGTAITLLGDGEVIIDCADTDPHAAFHFQSSDDTVILRNISVTNARDTIGAVRVDLADVYLINCRIYGNQTDGVRVTLQGRVTMDSCAIYDNTGKGIYVGDQVVPWGSLTATWTTISGNGEDGIYMKAFDQVWLENCTVVLNGQTGMFMEGDPPKKATFYDLHIQQCLVWQNGAIGIGRGYIGPEFDISCNNVFGNPIADYYNLPDSAGDTDGNISEEPLLILDGVYPSFPPTGDSPCAPANNSCGVLIGAWEPFTQPCACWTGPTGDIDRSGDINLTDLTLLVNHLFVTFTPLDCAATANCNGDSNCDITLTDLTVLVNSLFVTFEPTAALSEFDNCACGG